MILNFFQTINYFLGNYFLKMFNIIQRITFLKNKKINNFSKI